MVRDNVTGLIWEVKTVDGSIHDRDDTYTWQDAQDTFITQVNAETFGGHADWRLPTAKELASITALGRYNPAIDNGFFPNTVSSFYSSGTTTVIDSNGAWGIGFNDGYVGSGYKLYSFYVRCVRGGPAGSFDHLVINGDGTVTDTSTGLLWQQATTVVQYTSGRCPLIR